MSLSAAAAAVVDELDAIVGADGGRLVVVETTGSSVTLALDLSGSSCPECVLPKDLLVDLLRDRLRTSDPDIATVELVDPRES